MRAIRSFQLAVMLFVVAGSATGRPDEEPDAPADGAAESTTPVDSAMEFVDRLGDLTPGDADEAVELAQWALERGLVDEADMMYRGALREDPAHEVAYYDLWHLSRSRDLPTESEPYRNARQRLPAEFREYETRRYVILSDADPTWLKIQGQRLERTYNQFVRFVLRAGLRALPPSHKLVAVVFDDRADFMDLAKEDGTGGRIAGYYRLPEDRLVFYHVESNDNIVAARAELEEMRAEIGALHRAARRARTGGDRGEVTSLRAQREEQIRRHDDRAQRIDEFARQQSVSVTIHEAIHQLMFHCGVQSRVVQHPLWLTEGLATAFETDAPTLPFGPRHDYVQRRRGFYAILDQGKMLPIRDLITASPSSLMARPEVLYHQSYALVAWLSLYRKREFREYLTDLNMLPRGVPSPETQLQTFVDAFGDIDRLERSWLRYELGE